jgi:tetratricopeptide (TPR) repeat protein
MAKWVRRRPAAAGLLAAVVLLMAAGGIGAWVLLQQRAAARDRQANNDREVRVVVERARGLLEEAWQAADLAKLMEAAAEGSRAEDIARAGGAGAAVRQDVEAFQQDAGERLGRARKSRTLLEALLDVSLPQENRAYIRDKAGQRMVLPFPSVDEQYASAFRRWGLDVDGTAEAEVVRRLGAEPEPVMQELIAALDSWMLERRWQGRAEVEWGRLFRLADQLDRSERRRRLRALLVRMPPRRPAGTKGPPARDPAPGSARRDLLEMRAKIDPRTEPALTVMLLARAYIGVGDAAGAEKVLREAVTARPDQVVLLCFLGELLEQQGQSRLADAIGYYRAARSHRPHLGISLCILLVRAGRSAEVEELAQEMTRLQPYHPAFRFFLGIALYQQQKYGDAEAAFRKTIDLEPNLAEAHLNLGTALSAQQKHGDAEAPFRKAANLKPGYAIAYTNLGGALAAQHKYRQAETAYRKAIDVKPDDAQAHLLLGNALSAQDKHDRAETAYRKAIELKPDFSAAYHDLGNALRRLDKLAEAETAYRKAIDLEPDHARAHYSLGLLFIEQHRFGRAEAAFRKALELQPDFGLAYLYLGFTLIRQARFDEAAGSLKKADDLLPPKHPSREETRQLHQQCQRYRTLNARLPAVLLGTEKPANAAELIEYAQLCLLKRAYAAAARLSRDAFTAEPRLAENVPASTRYDAACAAALAGCGQGSQDADKLNDKERTRWRRQALEWLRQDLTWWRKALDKGKVPRAQVQLCMRQWQRDDDLAGVRGPVALARLPEEERKQWEKLWSDTDALLRRASEPR